MKFAAVNAARSIGKPESLSSLLSSITQSNNQTHLDMLFVAEFDGLHEEFTQSRHEAFEEAILPYKLLRHYGGAGNTSYAFIISPIVQRHLLKVQVNATILMNLLILFPISYNPSLNL